MAQVSSDRKALLQPQHWSDEDVQQKLQSVFPDRAMPAITGSQIVELLDSQDTCLRERLQAAGWEAADLVALGAKVSKLLPDVPAFYGFTVRYEDRERALAYGWPLAGNMGERVVGRGACNLVRSESDGAALKVATVDAAAMQRRRQTQLRELEKGGKQVGDVLANQDDLVT